MNFHISRMACRCPKITVSVMHRIGFFQCRTSQKMQAIKGCILSTALSLLFFIVSIVKAKKLLFTGDDQPRPYLGINVGPIDYSMNQWVFRNYFKHCKEWASVGTNDGWKTFSAAGSIPTNWSSDGYPTEFYYKNRGYQTVIGTSGMYPTGSYFLTYEGTGNLTILGDAEDVAKVSPNRFEFFVRNATTKGIVVIVTQAPVTNVFLSEVREEANEGSFSTDFINAISMFKAVRFSQWMVNRAGNFMHYNANANKEWEDRSPPTYYTQFSQLMVPVEYIVELANKLEKDIWLSIPSLSSKNHIKQLARFVKDNLSSKIETIYVEQSSEKGWGNNDHNLQMQLVSTWKYLETTPVSNTYFPH